MPDTHEAKSAARLAEHLKVLDRVKLDGVDYQTIGKITVASLFRQQESKVASQKPDEKGHIKLQGKLDHSFVMHVKPDYTICCWCYIDDNDIPICFGRCCWRF